MNEQLSQNASIDEIIDYALSLCSRLPGEGYAAYVKEIEELKQRLAHGRLHFAVLGQFNRGKSSFINALLGTTTLPSSVLPLTNVPTFITYGSREGVSIRFYNDTPDKEVYDDRDEITDLLCTYVTEEQNPNNRCCVEEVHVYAPSPLLENGTQIIDTPGFGSTYIHNTQRTVEMLCECDAAFFLLSADLPITQMEIEFLKQVYTYVPRVYFIYNKIDLLGAHEHKKIREFIHSTISKNFGYIDSENIFPVSVLQSTEEEGDREIRWKESGMHRVEHALQEFIRKEKYFVLSWALNKKFRDAVLHIRRGLQKERDEFNAAIESCHAAQKQRQQICRNVEASAKEESEAVAGYIETLCQYVDRAAERKKSDCDYRLQDYFNSIAQAGGIANAIKTVRVSFPALFYQLHENVFEAIKASLHGPFNEYVNARLTQFRQKVDENAGLIREQAQTYQEEIVQLTQRVAPAQQFEGVPPDTEEIPVQMALPFMKRLFGSASSWFSQYVQSTLHTFCADSIETLCNRVKEDVTAKLNHLQESMQSLYSRLYEDIETACIHKDALEGEKMQPLQEQMDHVAQLDVQFGEVEEHLRA